MQNKHDMKLIVNIALLFGLTLAAGKYLYYRGQCRIITATVGSAVTITEYDEGTTTSACNQMGGRFCDLGCVITGDSRTPDLTHSSWTEACTEAGADENDLIGQALLTKELIEELAGC